MNKIKKIVAVCTILLGTGFLFAEEQPFIIVEAKTPHNLNPYTTAVTSDVQILSGLYEGLFSYNPTTLEPEYAIANGFKVSRDKKRWIINIRPEATFSNGEAVTAQSVKDAWLMLLATPDAPYSSLLDIISGAKAFRTGNGPVDKVGIYAKDEHTLAIYLNTPANYLPRLLCHSSFSIVHRNPTVYSGAYVLEEYLSGGLLLTKNQYYWDKETAKLESIMILQSDDPKEIAYYFNTGFADWVTTYADVSSILNKNAIQYSAEFGTGYFFFKTSAKKPGQSSSVWDYPEFRNAVIEAFPWEAFRRNLIPATTFVYPLAGYPEVEGFSYTDELEASIRMTEAREKYNIPAEQILTLELQVGEQALSDASIEALAGALAPLGVELRLSTLPMYQYVGNVGASNADMFLYVWIGDFADPLAFLELFHGNSTLNDSGWHNAEFDSLLEKAASVSNEERYKLLAEAENILLDSGMVLPIYHPVCSNIINMEEVGGWAPNAFDIHPLKYLFKKEIKNKVPGLVRK